MKPSSFQTTIENQFDYICKRAMAVSYTHLDVYKRQPWNWSDGIGKQVMYGLYAITNFIWTISLYVSNATGYLVQEAY